MNISQTEAFINIIKSKGDHLDHLLHLFTLGLNVNSTFEIAINDKNETHSLLSYACLTNSTKIATTLIEKGADVNYYTKPDENTPIHLACKKYNRAIVSRLLDIDTINLNSLNAENETCFSIALKTSQKDIYAMIVQKINQKKSIIIPQAQLQLQQQQQLGQSPVKKLKSMFKRNIKGQLEIPFAFKKSSYGSTLGSFIKLSSVNQPSITVNIDELEKSELLMENKILKEKISYLESQLKDISEENNSLKNEVEDLNIKLEAAIKEEKINSKASDWNISQTNNNTSQRSSDNTRTNSSSNNSMAHGDYLQLKFKSTKKDMTLIKSSLQKDLIDYREYAKSNAAKDQELLDELLKHLQEAVNEISSEYEVKLYGSRATKLCLYWSDLDVVLIHKTKEFPNLSPATALDLLATSLKSKLWVDSIKYISTAKIPIIKLISTDKYSLMQIDISIQDSFHCGLKCVELVKSYITDYEVLEPLVLSIKTMLKLSSLNDPFTGGLSSYGIILMIVSFLKNEQMINHSIALGNIGSLFCDFLLFYGSKPNTNFVNVTNVNMVISTSPLDLIIIDPLNLNNNVAKSSFHFFDIKIMFLYALQSLLEDCPCASHYTNVNQNDELQHNFLRKMFNAVKRVNINMTESC